MRDTTIINFNCMIVYVLSKFNNVKKTLRLREVVVTTCKFANLNLSLHSILN